MKSSKYILSSLVIVSLLITALIPIRVASIAPFKLSTTAIAQQTALAETIATAQATPTVVARSTSLSDQMNQGKQNNDLVAEQKERQDDAIENMLKEA